MQLYLIGSESITNETTKNNFKLRLRSESVTIILDFEPIT